MKKIIIILLGLFLFPMTGMSQNKESYLKSAYASFEKGEYDNAQKALNVYVSAFDGDASELANKIQQCKDFMDKAENAIARQQIKDAIGYYRGVLSINPNDPIAKKKIADLGMTVKNDKPQVSSHKRVKTNPIKLISSGFEMRISSSFDSKGIFGFGFHFNKKYFKLGVDAIFSRPANGVEVDDWPDYGGSAINILNNHYFLLEKNNSYAKDGRLWYVQSEYVNPKFQFSISPGINMKYFSVECGLGVFTCENISVTEYKINTTGKEQYEGSHRNKSYFIARPTIVGYIPVSKKHDCISINIGYNFVSGAEPLNGFMFGLGFLWNISK